jgi:hypothetical protein
MSVCEWRLDSTASHHLRENLLRGAVACRFTSSTLTVRMFFPTSGTLTCALVPLLCALPPLLLTLHVVSEWWPPLILASPSNCSHLLVAFSQISVFSLGVPSQARQLYSLLHLWFHLYVWTRWKNMPPAPVSRTLYTQQKYYGAEVTFQQLPTLFFSKRRKAPA